MAGLDETGFLIKRYDELVSDNRLKAQELFGSGVDTSVNSVLGQIVQLSALELATLWEELQNVYDSFNPNAATGKSLDDLCSLVGVYRLDTEATQGYVEFTGLNGTAIPANTQVSNPSTGDAFIVTQDSTISAGNAYSITYQMKSVSDNAEYTISIDGIVSSYTTPASGNTVTTLRDGLYNALTANTALDSYTIASFDDDKLSITHNVVGNSFSATTNSSSVFSSGVTTLIYVRCTELGNIAAGIGSITQIDTSISGLDSVNNLSALVTGRDVETDDELRLRRSQRSSIVGKATPEAIARTVEAVQGVSDAFVIENRTLTTDIEGRPPKSYEVVVIGGETTSLAEAIWDSGPAGIETYGNISVVILDSNGDSQVVKFSRPESVYISFEVDYSIYDEEQFPSDGNQRIKEAIIEYAGNFNSVIGKDVIPQRYFGDIYSNVSGIENLVIRVGSSAAAGVPPASFDTLPIPISSRELADFNIDRIVVAEV